MLVAANISCNDPKDREANVVVCLSPNGDALSYGAEPAKRVLVATAAGVVALSERETSPLWESHPSTLSDRHVSSLLSETVSGTVFAGTHNGGLFRSEDEGESFSPGAVELDTRNVYSLAIERRGAESAVYAGIEPTALFVSHDLGRHFDELTAIRDVPGTETWTFPAPQHDSHVKCVTSHPLTPNTIFAGVEQGALLKSTDGGVSWVPLSSFESANDPSTYDIHRLVLGRSNPDEIFMTSGDGLFHSTNGGLSWRHLTDRAHRIGYPDFFFIDPLEENVVYLGGARKSPGAWRTSATSSAEPTVLRSGNRGETWEEFAPGLPEPVFGNIEALSMAVDPGGFRFFAATTAGEVYMVGSDRSGWQLIAEGLPPVSKADHYQLLHSAA